MVVRVWGIPGGPCGAGDGISLKRKKKSNPCRTAPENHRVLQGKGKRKNPSEDVPSQQNLDLLGFGSFSLLHDFMESRSRLSRLFDVLYSMVRRKDATRSADRGGGLEEATILGSGRLDIS